MAVNLKAMSRKELLKLKSDIDKALKDAEARERSEALKAAEKALAEFGYSMSDFSDTAGKKRRSATKGEAKYRNPENPSETWSGRGRKPGWIHDAIAKGTDLSTLEI